MMPSLALEGVEIAYDWSGPEQAPVLVLSNSLGTDRTMWTAQLESFSKHFRVLRYDTRGHGASSVPTGPYTIAQIGADVLALASALEVQRFAFCGLSLGGMTGLWLGIHAADRLNKLVLCNTAARIGSTESWNERIATVRSAGMASLTPRIVDRWFTASFQATHTEEKSAVAACLSMTSAEGYCSCCAAIRDMDQTHFVDQIQVPTLIICGESDTVTPCIQAQSLHEMISGSSLVSLPAAHLSNIECAHQFNQHVLAFLNHREHI